MARMIRSPQVDAASPLSAWETARGFRKLVGQEVGDDSRNLGGMGLKREMAGVEETHHCIRDVALERFGAWRDEERIVPAPHREETRLVIAEIVLEGRVERDVVPVVSEQIELHLIGPWPGQIEIVQRIAVRG